MAQETFFGEWKLADKWYIILPGEHAVTHSIDYPKRDIIVKVETVDRGWVGVRYKDSRWSVDTSDYTRRFPPIQRVEPIKDKL